METVVSDGLETYDGDLIDKTEKPKIAYTEPEPEGPYEWSAWTSCSASCGNGQRSRKYCNEKRCIESDSEVCHLKLCSKEKLMLSIMMSFRRLPMALHAANEGDTDALKMMLFRGNMFYTMLMDDDDLTATDIIKKFVRLQFAFKSSDGGAQLKSSSTGEHAEKLRQKDFILMKIEDGELDFLDFDRLAQLKDPRIAETIKKMIK